MTPTIGPGCAVTLSYTMTAHLLDGTTTERMPETLTFVYGIERQVPALEKALQGARSGDRLSVQVPSAEIYGDHDPSLVVEIPKEGLIRRRMKTGQFYRQMKGGSLISFKVLDSRPDTIVADFNKPMAGISVSLQAEVLSVREATESEIQKARESEEKRSLECA